MAGILRTDTIQNSNTSTIITQTNSTTITIGTTGQTVSLDGGIIKSGSTTLTIGTSGQTVALASGATSSGFGATYNGAVNWDTTVKTTGFTAVSGTGYFVNTTSGAVTVTLPATPSAGAIVGITDYAGTAATNNITIGRNGSKIEGATENGTLYVNRDTVTLIYVDSTQGWVPVVDNSGSALRPLFVTATGGTITTCGNYKIHTFTGSGCFVVSCAGNALGSSAVDYLVVAGGGGGGKHINSVTFGGGGGAGGYRESVPNPAAWTTSPIANPGGSLPVTATTYPITVGGGGGCSSTGSNSIFSTITSAGGGRGFGGCGPGTCGGSGGTQYRSGNTPPVSPPQGNSGADGGGGGAGTAAPGPNGGNGVSSSITGSSVARGGGGGSSVGSGNGSGGTGGGGPWNGQPGTVNTGGGGGGGGFPGATQIYPGGNGGSGIIAIRYKYQ
jgi:hypothetical protein